MSTSRRSSRSPGKRFDLEPTYQPVDYVTANALLPKWGGSAELLNRFVALVIARSSAVEGNQAYARIMFNIARSDPDPFAAANPTRSRIAAVLRASLEQIATTYPDPWNWNAERAMACLMGTQQDVNGASRRAAPGLIPVAWFDSAVTWPECEQRQNRARQSTFASWTQALISTPPSASFVAAATAGALLTLTPAMLTDDGGMTHQALQHPLRALLRAARNFPNSTESAPLGKSGICFLFGFLLLGAVLAAWVLGVIAPETRNSPPGLVLVFLVAVASGAAVLPAEYTDIGAV